MLPFVDVFLLLLITVLALINPPQEDGKITPRSEAMLTMEWDDKQKSDIDVWVLTPDGNKVYFVQKDAGHTVLHRDDLGISNDKYINERGETVYIEQNIEVLDFVTLIDGEYLVSGHDYRHRDNGEVEVEINLIVMDPFYTAARETRTFSATNQEIPFFSFVVKDGKIIQLNPDSKVHITGRR